VDQLRNFAEQLKNERRPLDALRRRSNVGKALLPKACVRP